MTHDPKNRHTHTENKTTTHIREDDTQRDIPPEGSTEGTTVDGAIADAESVDAASADAAIIGAATVGPKVHAASVDARVERERRRQDIAESREESAFHRCIQYNHPWTICASFYGCSMREKPRGGREGEVQVTHLVGVIGASVGDGGSFARVVDARRAQKRAGRKYRAVVDRRKQLWQLRAALRDAHLHRQPPLRFATRWCQRH